MAGKPGRALFSQFLQFSGRDRDINPGITQPHLKLQYHVKNNVLNQDNNERKRVFRMYKFVSVIEHFYKHQVLCGLGCPCDFTESFFSLNYLIAKGIWHNGENSTALETAQENND